MIIFFMITFRCPIPSIFFSTKKEILKILPFPLDVSLTPLKDNSALISARNVCTVNWCVPLNLSPIEFLIAH